ncbi:MAG: transcriptional regulator GcvA [Alphaproteobacteria bacterium]|nr:transcriptional regulator GcvA [Alphaproteobacteria bacterium]
MTQRFPPLGALRVFEAAGRHLSFKAAAAELGLTPSAVSHSVHALEDWLGLALFHRANRGLSLTADGAAYLPAVRQSFEILERATADLPGRPQAGRLVVSGAPSFTSRWLLPLLPRFTERHPDIEVTLDTRHRMVEFPRDGVDVAIRMAHEPAGWGDVHAEPLARERLIPVCAPDLAARLKTPADLAGQTLLHVSAVADDWASWARAAGVLGLDLSRGLRFDAVHLALDAAVQGLGVAMGRLPLVARDLDTGRLAPLFGPPLPCGSAYWLVAGPSWAKRPEIAAFRQWLLAELGPVEP